MEDCVELRPVREDTRVAQPTLAPSPEDIAPRQAAATSRTACVPLGGEVPKLFADDDAESPELPELADAEPAVGPETWKPSTNLVIGGPPRLARMLSRVDPPELNFGTEVCAVPLPHDGVDANDRLFVRTPAKQTHGGVSGRLSTWVSATLRGLGIVGPQPNIDAYRLRIHAGDPYVPADERVAYRLLVEGGAELKRRLLSADIEMDAVVGCGVSVQVTPPPPRLCLPLP